MPLHFDTQFKQMTFGCQPSTVQLIEGDGTAERPLRTVVIDFGVSLCREDLDRHGMTQGLVGSAGFYAPEMLSDAPFSPAKADLFSLGCVLLEMVTLQLTYRALAPDAALLYVRLHRPLIPRYDDPYP